MRDFHIVFITIFLIIFANTVMISVDAYDQPNGYIVPEKSI